MNYLRHLGGALGLLMLLSGCGPSAEQSATMTAVAWTPTPPPTATSIPFDLTVTIMDAEGNPISWAQVSLPDRSESQMVDPDGILTINGLPQSEFSAKVNAQGYLEQTITSTLQQGANELVVTLQRSPFSLLPSEACAENEKLLYLEDFQDGQVENWGSYPQGTPFVIEPDPDATENKVLALNFGELDGEYQINTIPNQENVVRRLKYKPGDHSRFNLGWGFGNNTYFAVLSADGLSLNYYSEASGGATQLLGSGKPAMQQGVWHTLEVSSYGENIEVWVDGSPGPAYQGQLINDGNILHIGAAYLPAESIVLIDDIAICGLNGSFVPLYTPSN